MAAAPPLRDRLSFLHRLPILLKGTSDDDVPCPGYLFEEIAKISHESPGSSQCLLEYLLSRLHSSSGHGKLKVLKILLYLCSHGSSSFLLILKRNSAFIQEAAAFAGPPDPLHGNSLYQKVRAAAQDLGSTLFSDTVLPLAPSQPLGNPPATGMGSQARPHSTLQGFGYSKEHGRTGAGSAGEAFLSTIQKAAEVVANAMRPGPESPSTQRLLPRGDTYQPATMPSASHGPPTLGNPLPGAIPGPRGIEARAPPPGVWVTASCHRWGFAAMEANPRASHTAGGDGTRGGSSCPLGLVFAEAGAKVATHPQLRTQGPGRWAWGWPEALGISRAILFPPAVGHQPGQAGGGWDELDSSPSSQNSSQNSELSRVSDSGSHSGSDSHSGASREPGDLPESRVEVVALSDCQQELSLVRTVTRGPRAFLSREEAQRFIKACGLLNCEAVLQLLTCHLRGTSECTQLRALCAIASLGSADLLPQEHILLRTRPRLQELSMGSPGPVTNKATKILRHFEASCGQLSPAGGTSAEPGPTAALPGPSDLLTDAVPLAGSQLFLQPLSSTAVSCQSPAPSSGMPPSPVPTPPPDASPIPACGDPSKAKARLAESRGWGPEQVLGGTDSPKRGPSNCAWSRDSLFAGMELVACPRLVGAGAAAGESCLDAPRAPQTSSQRTAVKEPPGSEPSAFAFLNA
ncbi:AP-4 complex accessory subunit tepsin isoform X3 [Trachypithecus francoisi]|uniref:AP-4 complex accessory subunit tepsin isoform X3 n=1 Tax=Trachypithecus francoisi TaxID=54180 RepID=UPI00141ABE9C|nr:AP-4 complex accessory subunit tepsin isoform X3 [Trachypithecus francoisi]